MVSGALILRQADKNSFKRFFFVRIRRILIPFIIWSAVYFFYRIHFKADSLGTLDFFQMLLTEPIYYHLWFVYMLIVLYMLAPAAGAFLNYAPRKHGWYLVGFWFFWASLLPIIDKPLPFETYFTPDLNDYSALRLSGYFLLGYMLRDHLARSGFQLVLTAATFLTAGAATILGTYWLSLGRGEFHPFFYKYFSITVVAMSVSLFLFIKSIFNTRQERAAGDRDERVLLNSPRILQEIGMSVFGVYLVHAMMLELLRDGRFGFVINHTSAFGVDYSPAVGIPLFALTIFVFSIVPILIVRLIPILRELVT